MEKELGISQRIEEIYISEILLLTLYPREVETHAHAKACTEKVLARASTIVKIWKQISMHQRADKHRWDIRLQYNISVKKNKKNLLMLPTVQSWKRG